MLYNSHIFKRKCVKTEYSFRNYKVTDTMPMGNILRNLHCICQASRWWCKHVFKTLCLLDTKKTLWQKHAAKQATFESQLSFHEVVLKTQKKITNGGVGDLCFQKAPFFPQYYFLGGCLSNVCLYRTQNSGSGVKEPHFLKGL